MLEPSDLFLHFLFIHSIISLHTGTSAPCKTCQLDLVPTWLAKEMHALLSPLVSLLMNKSLADGCFPPVFKKAVVCPLGGLDASELKNYRPVS